MKKFITITMASLALFSCEDKPVEKETPKPPVTDNKLDKANKEIAETVAAGTKKIEEVTTKITDGAAEAQAAADKAAAEAKAAADKLTADAQKAADEVAAKLKAAADAKTGYMEKLNELRATLANLIKQHEAISAELKTPSGLLNSGNLLEKAKALLLQQTEVTKEIAETEAKIDTAE